MAGLSQSKSQSPKGQGTRRSRKPRERKLDASLAPGTSYNDLGLGRRLAEPEAEKTWRFTIYRLNSPRRTGTSTCTTYADANDAAGDILGEYFSLAGVPPEGRKVYTCDVNGLGPNEGQTGGAEGRDWA